MTMNDQFDGDIQLGFETIELVSNLTQNFKAEFNSKYNSVSAKTENVFIVLLFHIT